MVNFANNLTLHARGEPDKPALIEGDRTISFAELDALTNRFAGLLDRHGLVAGDRVLIHAHNTVEFVVAFFGTMKHGAIAAPVNKRLKTEDLQRVVGHARPRLVVTDRSDRDRFAGSGATVLDFDDGADGGEGGGEGGSFWTGLRAQSPQRPERGAQGDEIANLLFTSGTTGMPKAAIHTHHMRHAIAGAMASRFELSRRDVGLAVSPLFHTGGLSVLCNCIHVGATCVLMPKWDPRAMLAAATGHGVTFAHFVSTLVVDITDLPDEAFSGASPRLRMTWSGGHSVDEWRLAAYERRMGGVLVQGYTRTEGGVAYHFPHPGLRSFAHNGYPCRDSSELAIHDAVSGGFCPPGVAGEIVVRGDGVSPGYWEPTGIRRPETLSGGWVRTGDAGFLDDTGALHFRGRIDHMIKSGGENVFPAEVEQAIIALPEVGNVVVVGTPDPRFGEVVSALVVPKGPGLDSEGLRGRLRDRLAGYKIPRRIRFVDELPRLGSGKVDLAQSRALLTAVREPEQ